MTSISPKPLRQWPGVLFAVLTALLWFVLPGLLPDDLAVYALMGGLASAVAVGVWWLFFSRAPWIDRLWVIGLAIVGVLVTGRFVHPSIAGGMQTYMLPIFATPVLAIALAASVALSRRFAASARCATMAAAILLSCGLFTMIRTDGIIGMRSELRLRWTPTPEERLLAQAANEKEPVAPPVPTPAPSPAPATAAATTPPTAAAPAISPAIWPGFRGPDRDNVSRGVKIDTDWSSSPPVELWRRPIGPGWSSFAVSGTRIYTQEQRGEAEMVSCHDLATGQVVWRHRDTARFWESNAGAGPRATPTVSGGRVYTLGATGIANALDAGTGAVLWSRNAAADTGAPMPGWGFAGSPLVVNDMVVVATSGRIVAYDTATGKLRWSGKSGGSGYSSPQLATIGGAPQILLVNTSGAIGLAPADGATLWTHEWNADGIVQPYVIGGSDVLLGSGSGAGEVGIRRVSVTSGAGGWTAAERWTSRGLKPYFSDFVVHHGHAFGFDGSILSCIDLADGTRKWKGGRYGQGQMVLLADQDALLVLSEEGELAIVSATSGEFKELARFRALEGKTWNHPVLVGDIALVRNAEEMAAFRMKVARQ